MLDRAQVLHRQGRLPEAELLYREILERFPRHTDTMSALGILYAQRGDATSALGWIEKAVAIQPGSGAYRFNYGKTLLQMGRAVEACDAFEQAASLDPGYAEAHHALGLARENAGDLAGAEKALRRALSLEPRFWEAHNNLGLLLHRLGRSEEAESSLRKVLEIAPGSVDGFRNLGMVLRAQKRAAEALDAYRAALALKPGDPATLSNLGNVLVDLRRNEEASAAFREALAREPRYADAYYNWGTLHLRSGEFQLAADKFRAALAIDPRMGEAQSGLASALLDLGRVDEAIEAGRRTLELRPDDREAHSQLLFSLLHSPEESAHQVFEDHLEWARRHTRLSPKSAAHKNARDPERRLRVGYVSGDFREHPVAQFLEPVLARHDRAAFEIFCYHNLPHADGTTGRLRRLADQWREVATLGDDAMADRVREDGIDVLVDLSGHTRFNRLPVFARKPAPVQATWLGYLGTTGLDTIDYRITDGRASPEGLSDAFHTEKLIRLPDCQWCYQAPPDCPPVASRAAAHAQGALTLGSFSSLAKVGPRVIALWCRLLERLEGARLLVVGLGLERFHEEFRSRFVAEGVVSERIELRGFQSFYDYLALHGTVDLMLDTFPYTGGTTTCHALWMGVPVISLAGRSAASRGGASVLGTIGLYDMVADTPDDYLDKACALASDGERLSTLRTGMRNRMLASPLMDATRFTRHLEEAYRTMWENWCHSDAEPRA